MVSNRKEFLLTEVFHILLFIEWPHNPNCTGLGYAKVACGAIFSCLVLGKIGLRLAGSLRHR